MPPNGGGYQPQRTGCPFASSVAAGQRQQLEIEMQQDALVEQNLLITPEQPASGFWSSGSRDNETVTLYDRSMSLLLAQQNFMQTCPAVAGKNATTVLSALSDQVPLVLRRKQQPICDPSYLYVQASGVCNNLRQPNQGASYTPLSRLIPATFADGKLVTLHTIKF